METINNIKSLGIDMIDNASSGHPGIVLGAAPILYTLYYKHMRIDPSNPFSSNRDRFVLSAGHGSALLYATLYMAGFITLEDLKNFRQLNSITPGHPEYKVTPGVDMSTGPLGQGVASAVGMAIASKLNTNYNVYTLVGDGDLMEGISYEALSLAGSMKLNNLIVLYDSNQISLDGTTKGVFDENIKMRFEAIDFNVITLKNSSSDLIDKAILKAKKSSKPTIIEIRTIIGQDSVNEGTNKVHGSPLSKEDIIKLKETLNIPNIPFYVNDDLRTKFIDEIKKRVPNSNESDLNGNLELSLDLEDEELRVINGKVMNEIASKIPNFIGGSADLGSSNKTILNNFASINDDFKGRNIKFGVREHAMGAILNGLAISGFKVFGSTFLSFSDYLKPSIRLSALMNLPVTYVFTHDSINIGEDGPTHQPIEQLASLRSIPNLYVFRPCDGNEIVGCWEYIINNGIPSCMVISREKTGIFESSKNVSKGAYIIRKEKRLDAIIIATGSEVKTALLASEFIFKKYGIDIRVISMPCKELYDKQELSYKDKLIPKGKKVIVIEAGSKYGFEGYVYDDKYLITVDNFGTSAKKEDVLTKMNFSYEIILKRIIKLLT